MASVYRLGGSKGGTTASNVTPTITAGELIAQARASDLNRTARKLAAQQYTVGGNNALVPLVFGQMRVGGRVAAITVPGRLYAAAVWCLGEIDSVVDVDINDGSHGSRTDYVGDNTQGVDATLAAEISGYADNLRGYCYSALDLPTGTYGFPRMAAVIKGIKVPLSSGGTPTWTDNPAYLIAALIENSTYGMGRSVDWASVATAAAFCDELVGGERRHILNLALDTSQPADVWIESIRDYAGVFVVPEGASYRLVVDGPGTSVMSFTESNIISGSFSETQTGLSDTPTMVEITYTDTSSVPYSEARYSTAATSPRRLSRISRPGITRLTEATRYATERLAKATLCRWTCRFDTFDEALAVQVADLIDVTTSNGRSAKVYRVGRIEPIASGRWRITATEYDEDVYTPAD